MKLLVLLSLFTLMGCGAAKTQYTDTKYELCVKGCELKYSRYNYKKMAECRSHCHQNRQKDAVQ